MVAQSVRFPQATFNMKATAGIRGGGTAGAPGVINAHALLSLSKSAGGGTERSTDGTAKALDPSLDRHRVAGHGPVFIRWPMVGGRPSRYVTGAGGGGGALSPTVPIQKGGSWVCVRIKIPRARGAARDFFLKSVMHTAVLFIMQGSRRRATRRAARRPPGPAQNPPSPKRPNAIVVQNLLLLQFLNGGSAPHAELQ